MNAKEALEGLNRIYWEGDDTEQDHIAADRILCGLLIELGYTEVVEAFDKLDRRYA